jgi:hypothetical protein
MKTTELYVEQVLIGFLVMAIALLPWLPEALCAISTKQTFANALAAGSAALGIAFFLGIPFDRMSDTLSERLDKLQRLSLAFELARTGKAGQRAQATRNGQAQQESKANTDDDLFPENQYLLDCLTGSEELVERQDYLRSRIRLVRALAVFGPALTLMAAYGASRYLNAGACTDLTGRAPVNEHIYGLAATAYLIWMLLVLAQKSPPRTNDKTFVDNASAGRWISSDLLWVKGERHIDGSIVPQSGIWIFEWRTWLVPVALLAATLVGAGYHRDSRVILVAVTAAAVTVLSAWCWWRISLTYRTFLNDVHDYAGNKAPHR